MRLRVCERERGKGEREGRERGREGREREREGREGGREREGEKKTKTTSDDEKRILVYLLPYLQNAFFLNVTFLFETFLPHFYKNKVFYKSN
jgi:hypothetical protein